MIKRNDKNVRKKTLEYLKGQRLMALATSSLRGEPHAATMLYVVDDDFNFYFVTKENTRKAAHLAENPNVALTIGHASPMNVQAEGAAAVVADEALRSDLVVRLAEAGGSIKDFWPPVLRIEAGDYMLFRVKPRWVRVLDLEASNVNEADPPFVEIIP